MKFDIIFLTNLKVSKKEKLVVSGLRVDITKYDTDHWQAVLLYVRKRPGDTENNHTLLSPPSYTARVDTRDSVFRPALRSMKC
jgi:hypothetical protein